ncbi:pullulanase-type alpha-1,6-glucosidase [Thalassotalea sp. M1531]|uniref:Pullulanase-type alpha-1,6-glucosidase n=1 Tax=Thalassotalea algicola TaxID=2716224 RepID=A0A7Y0LAW8_9GAMM|nr:pullulanase-type alpha-1,6-glucosidase [Thalassotalea algicola]NMP30869.1 pullulanase-type alpha-1,6-glucosidase [Thalassotalea algicola]
MNKQFRRLVGIFAAICVLFGASVQASIQDEIFYFVLPDRFSNGDTSNDNAGVAGDRSINGHDASDAKYYHGGDLKGLTKKLSYLKLSGITALWITPPFKNQWVQGNSAGYHGYWATDYSQIDPHWGTNAEFKEFVKRAHRLRMKVFLDVVVNHTGDVIKYQQCHNQDGSLKDGLANCPYLSLADKATNPYTPFIPAELTNAKSPSWLNDPQFYNNQGDSTFSGESSVYGDFFGLDDLDTTNPQVVAGMIDIFKQWISDYKIDGFRVDTIKHVDVALWQQWIPEIKAHAKSEKIKDFFIFGEMFDGLPANLSYFTRTAKFPSVLDFGLYFAIKDVVADTQGTDRLAWLFSQDDMYTSANSHANQLMNFVSNHDVGRIGHFIQQMPNVSEEEALKRAKLAQTLMYFNRGVPVVYYGDEQGFTGDGGDSEAREDMFASQVAEYNDNNLIGTSATTADDNFDRRHPIYKHLRNMAIANRIFPALHRGHQFVRYSQDKPGVFAVSRFDPIKRREALVVFNTSTAEQSITLDAMASKYTQAWPFTRPSKISGEQLTVTVPPLDVVVLYSISKIKLAKDLPEIAITSINAGDKVSGLVEVKAKLTGFDQRAYPLHRVHFSVSVDGGDFQALGTDYTNDLGTSDYKVYFDTSELTDGSQLTFKADVDNYKSSSNSTQVQVEKGVTPGIKITFEKPDSWQDVNIYWWNASPQASADWPGVAMSHINGNWYEFQFEDDVKAANIIFNNGAGEQTSDLYREGDGCYLINSDAWQTNCDVPAPGITAYFKKPANWGDSANIYFWDAAPQADVSWPGSAMEHVGGDWYKFQFDDNVTSANLIFNDGLGEQTADLTLSSDGCYVEGAWLANCQPPTAGMKLYFKKPAAWSQQVNIHYWAADGEQAASDWPGVAMTNEGNDWFSFNMPVNTNQASFLFLDNTGYQTDDLNREGDGCYIDSMWQDTCSIDVAEPGMTIYVRRPLSWNVPNVYYWNVDNAPAWPGVEMDALGDDWFSFQFPQGVNAANLIINDLMGNQTADLFREGEGCFDLQANTWSDSCATPGYTAYFEKPTEWQNANAYFWNTSPEDAANVGWPGAEMTSLGDNWFSYQLPNGVNASNIIFNNAGSPQTSDLYREGDGCYSQSNGWTDTCAVPQPGMTVYFYKPDTWGSSVNLYYWDNPEAQGWPGNTMTSLGDNWYSFTFPQGVTNSNLIFNDGGGNQTSDLYQENSGCYGEFGDNWRKSCILPETRDVEILNRAAHWLTGDIIAWQTSDNRASQFKLLYSQTAAVSIEQGEVAGADGEIALASAGSLTNELQQQNPHLANLPSLQLSDVTQIETALKSQLVVAAYDDAGNLLEATYVQTPRVLDALYANNQTLGVSYQAGTPSVSVWAPTAQQIELVLYDQDGTESERIAPTSVNQGVYLFNGQPNWDKQYYRFAVTVYHPASNAIESYLVTDPYAVSLSENSQLSQFLDLANDALLKPESWDNIEKSLPAAKDITLYEGHVRDFSQHDLSVPEAHRGKYLAFGYNGEDNAALSNGMSHLKSLAQAGLSHFHLLPVFDIASVNEDRAARVELDDSVERLCQYSDDEVVQSHCATAAGLSIAELLTNLAEQDSATTDVQAIVSAMDDLDGFNWGYDPLHFNAPEGSYATANDGVTRVKEFREMVKSLDEVDLKLVMDVVYNHTSASGLWDNSVLDKMVPGYYHRLNPVTGAVESSTCCDNTATEHRMMERLMVDTLVHWAKAFKVDSFRFDLMGHIPKSAMVKAQQALAQLTLANDQVDGANIYLYGEGWDFGEVSGNQRFEQATQFNMAGTGIATFNDRLRDGIRGGNFTDSGQAQGWANGNATFDNGAGANSNAADQADRIRIGMSGNLQTYQFEDHQSVINSGVNYNGVGYTLDPQESVNYVDKHDNESLWDNTQAKLPAAMSAEERVRIHLISNAIINYGQGVPFYQMGSDILRSKSLDRNSYNSGDWFNKVDFNLQDNNWNKGLPPAQDNQNRYSAMQTIIANGNINVSPSLVAQAHQGFKEQLQVRYSSPLFRLDDAQEVNQRLGFHNTGSSQVNGLLVMTLSDGICTGSDIDPAYDGITVLINSDDQPQQYTLEGTEGSVLHPVLANGEDTVVKQSNIEGNRFTIPALTAAVFVKPQGVSQGSYPCNPVVAEENQPGMMVYFKKPEGWAQSYVYYWNTSPIAHSVDWPGQAMTSLGDSWYSYQLPSGVNASQLIFNDNSGNQSADLQRSGDGCFDLETALWSDSCVLPGLKLYFKKAVNWSDNVQLYYWGAQGIADSNWPGVPMQEIGDGWFFYQMAEGVRQTNLIFNDATDGGSGEHTSDLSRSRNGCYQFDTGLWTESCDVPVH